MAEFKFSGLCRFRLFNHGKRENAVARRDVFLREARRRLCLGGEATAHGSGIVAWVSPFEGAKGARQNLKEKAAWGETEPASQKAWVYDAAGQTFRLAGWLRPNPRADVRAIEVSVDSLLEDLRRGFPDRLETSKAYALVDPAGKIVHRHAEVVPENR